MKYINRAQRIKYHMEKCKKQTTYRIKMINTIQKLVQKTHTTLLNTGIQYMIIIIGN